MSVLTNSFWLGDLSSFEGILKLESAIDDRMAKALETGQKFDLYAGYADSASEEDEDLDYQIINGIAVIPVKGNLITNETWISRLFGMTSYQGLRRQLTHAAENSEVNRILMDFDTPGGNSEGVDEAGMLIASIDKDIKPVHGYTSGSANSAGYWLISACRDVTCTKMSNLGSIGVVTIHKEVSKMLKDQGVEVTVFRDGEMKAKPNMYEKLDEKTKTAVNNSLTILGNYFLDWVSEQRGIPRDSVRAAVGEGRVFFGNEAVTNGLADRIMFFDEFIKKLALVDSVAPANAQYLAPKAQVAFSQDLNSEEFKTQIVSILEETINNRDVVLLSNPDTLDQINQPEDTDMSVDKTKVSKAAGTKIQTANGEMTLEAAQACVELGTLKQTEELKTAMAAAMAEDTEGTDESTDLNADTGDVEGAEGTDMSAASDEEPNEGGDPVVAHVQSQLTEQISLNTKMQLELESVKAKLSTQDDTVEALSQIAMNSCQKMTLAMGGMQIDMSAMDVATLLNHHNTLAAQFTASFNVGGVAATESTNEHATEDDVKYASAPLATVTF